VTAPQPGPDEVIVSAADGRLCNSLGCANDGQAAEVLVTFGTFGSHWERDATWPECWGRTYPMCTECWKLTCAALQRARPNLTVQAVPDPGTAPGGPGV
jgi:hypothetical protein